MACFEQTFDRTYDDQSLKDYRGTLRIFLSAVKELWRRSISVFHDQERGILRIMFVLSRSHKYGDLFRTHHLGSLCIKIKDLIDVIRNEDEFSEISFSTEEI